MAGRVIRGRLYGVCANCGGIIRMDKPIFGDLHFCTSAEERRKPKHAEEVRARCKANEEWLASVEG